MDDPELILHMALEAGFDLAGVAPLAPPAAAERFQTWLSRGHHADMAWLERNAERIVDPRRILPTGRSMLVVGLGHHRPGVELEGGGRVARYAAGRDYHNKMTKLLRKLVRRLQAEGLVERTRVVVDAGPLLERSHAQAAGLGFESKAANLLHPRFGPWFFLGEVLLDRELTPTPTPPAGSCGTCTACLDACPTVAILEPGVVDSNRCISYQTIENRGPIPHELREDLGEWLFGCDVCSEVCPWGTKAGDQSAGFGTHAAVEGGTLARWLRQDAAGFPAAFEGSALRRPGRDGLARNAAIVLGNRPSDQGRGALLQALTDPSPLVREAALWGLIRAHGAGASDRQAAERAFAAETDAGARTGMAESLARR